MRFLGASSPQKSYGTLPLLPKKCEFSKSIEGYCYCICKFAHLSINYQIQLAFCHDFLWSRVIGTLNDLCTVCWLDSWHWSLSNLFDRDLLLFFKYWKKLWTGKDCLYLTFCKYIIYFPKRMGWKIAAASISLIARLDGHRTLGAHSWTVIVQCGSLLEISLERTNLFKVVVSIYISQIVQEHAGFWKILCSWTKVFFMKIHNCDSQEWMPCCGWEP